MLGDVEEFAAEAQLHLRSRGDEWAYSEEWPHITKFHYDLATYKGEEEKIVKLGWVDGYRIMQDWSVESDLQIWDEADALDGDIVRYVEALIREVRACEAVFDFAPDVTTAQRITILRHVEAAKGADSAELTQAVAASLAMMDAPVLMLVDPWPISEERRTAKGKLKGRGHVPKLLELGFVRMVGSRFVWAWNRELSDNLMAGYSYEKLLQAKRKGTLNKILKTPISEDVYGKMPSHLAKMVDLPEPDDLTSE